MNVAETARNRGVKRNNGVFIIPLFLLKNFHYSIIPPKKAHIIPLIQEQNFPYSYSIIPLQPATRKLVIQTRPRQVKVK